MGQSLNRRGKPRSKAVLHPVRWPQQNDASDLKEEHAKVAIATLGDTPEGRSITSEYLLGDQTEPSSKIAAACEGSSIADRGDDGARDDRTYAWYRNQMLTRLRVLGERFDFDTYRSIKFAVATSTFGWYKAAIWCDVKYLILRSLLVRGDSPPLGTIPQSSLECPASNLAVCPRPIHPPVLSADRR
jgi:hypothetical protein